MKKVPKLRKMCDNCKRMKPCVYSIPNEMFTCFECQEKIEKEVKDNEEEKKRMV